MSNAKSLAAAARVRRLRLGFEAVKELGEAGGITAKTAVFVENGKKGSDCPSTRAALEGALGREFEAAQRVLDVGELVLTYSPVGAFVPAAWEPSAASELVVPLVDDLVGRVNDDAAAAPLMIASVVAREHARRLVREPVHAVAGGPAVVWPGAARAQVDEPRK